MFSSPVSFWPWDLVATTGFLAFAGPVTVIPKCFKNYPSAILSRSRLPNRRAYDPFICLTSDNTYLARLAFVTLYRFRHYPTNQHHVATCRLQRLACQHSAW